MSEYRFHGATADLPSARFHENGFLSTLLNVSGLMNFSSSSKRSLSFAGYIHSNHKTGGD